MWPRDLLVDFIHSYCGGPDGKAAHVPTVAVRGMMHHTTRKWAELKFGTVYAGENIVLYWDDGEQFDDNLSVEAAVDKFLELTGIKP